MFVKALVGLVASEIVSLKYTARRSAKRLAVKSSVWIIAGIILLAALGCFVVAFHIALAAVLPPIGAWLVTGICLFVLGLLVVVTLLLTGQRSS